MRRVDWLWPLILALLFCIGAAAQADERILDFHAAIAVHADGSMRVTETIRVRAEGREIRRGIYRDLPLSYRGPGGQRYSVGFRLLSVSRDGQPEAYHTKSLSNGIRIYLGRKDHLLAPGVYTYTLIYRTDRQLGFFKDHDELYWNVTGNGWAFPIDHASASVELPAGVPRDALGLEAYTGPQGARGKDYRAWLGLGGTADFATTAALPRHAGLTVVVSWPKGYVRAPSAEQRLHWWWADNRPLVFAGGGLLLLLLYFLIVWYRVGRDPEAGVIIPRYQPPEGLSPAVLRFVERMGYDDKTFACALVGMAAKGVLKIDEEDGEFVLERIDGADANKLTPGEDVLRKRLLSRWASFVLRRGNYKSVQKARRDHETLLRREYEARYFRTNRGYLTPGIVLLLATYAVTVLTQADPQARMTGLFLSVWLGMWSVGVYTLAIGVFGAWRKALRSIGAAIVAVVTTAFAVPFFIGEAVGLGMLVHSIGGLATLLLGAAMVLSILFYHLLKAPTLAGRKLLDQVEGFRLYLSVAEGDELKLAGPPRQDAQLYEAYLPYAMALDVENAWSERFARSLRAAGLDPDSYTSPSWYHGSPLSGSLAGVGGALSQAMEQSVATASASPSSSSSGSGGGGSSGGGGGGGGGGGW
ncbi:MAG: DUF2207 domain-containing protein [Acidihalobacter sp.]|uniref:DUF2207 domain-containing protein n=1 Tax=Acidihalobacter sp. TaxID=1872108 RepID=UPI00307E591E